MADELSPGELAQVDTTIPEVDLESFDPETNTARFAFDTPGDIEGSYTATRQVTEEMDAVDELEAEFGAELDAEEEGREPTPEPATKLAQPGAEEDGGVDVGAILSDIGRGIIELPVQTVGGVRDAAQETMEAIDSLAGWLDSNVADLSGTEIGRIDLPEIVAAETVTGGVSRGIIQFVAGMVGAGKITRLSKLKNLSKISEAGRLGIQGAIADGIARDPNEENLANLIRELTGEQESAVLNFMSSDPDDSEAVARLKKALEGFGVGALVDGLILGLGAIRASRGLKSAGEKVREGVEGAGQRAEQRIDERRESRGTTLNTGVDPRELTDPLVALAGRVAAKGKTAPAFHSNATTAVEAAKFEKGTAEQFLALKGLKKEEIEFTGLDEFLSSAGRSVTKAEVLEYLDQNGVKLEETVLGGQAPDGAEIFRRFDAGEITAAERDVLLSSNPGPDFPKFEQYTLPGGENYRELLIRLPAVRPTRKAVDDAFNAVEEFGDAKHAKYGNGWVDKLDETEQAEHGRLIRARDELEDTRHEQVGTSFEGSHFDEPNVLAHVRFNERVDADGSRVLFIEEIQSDWHQRGRQFGYGQLPGDGPLRARNVDAEGGGRFWEVTTADGQFVTNVTDANIATESDAIIEARRRIAQDPTRTATGNRPPNAPFKKTWHELGLKRMIRHAAENDFDSIAWTTGAQQADRYDLSKHVDRLTWVPSTGEFHAFKGNSMVLQEKNVAPEKLDELIGKEPASRLRESAAIAGHDPGKTPFHRLEGQDLKVGGEGLKTFYDKMLPQAANRIGKKFGAKAGEITIPGKGGGTDGLDLLDQAANDGDMTYRTLTAEIRRGGLDAEDLGVSDDEFQLMLVAAQGGQETMSVHTFPVTPELKKQALENGLPLFSAGGAAGLAADQIDVSPPDILLSEPFVPGEPTRGEGEETQVAGVASSIIRGFRKVQSGADEITRQRLGPGAGPKPLVGDLEKPLIETVEGATPQQFLDETGAPPLPDKAININLAKLDTTDDIKRAIDETANLFGREIDEARRGVQTNEATANLASDMGMTVEQLLSRRKGEAFNAETALAARRMLASSASQLVDLATKAADNGGDRELLAFRRAMVIHKAIQEQVSGLTAEAGRALQSFKILAGTEREMTRNVQEMIDAAGGSRVSRKMAERLAEAAEDGALTRAQLNEVVRKGALARTSDAFLEVWINGLLSGPQTQAVNILSNSLVALWQIPTRFIASKIPGGGVDGVAAGESKALLYGMIRGYSEGLILAGRALRTGESTDVLAKIDLPQRRAISSEAFNMSGVPGQAVDLLGEAVRLPGRFLVAGDELFKAVGYRMELSARAFRQAASEGLEGDAMARRIDEVMRNPPEDIRLASIDAGRYQTFTKPLGEGGKALQSMINAVPVLRLVMPFIRTPVNIMKFVGEGTVLAPLSRNVRAEIAAGGARRQTAMAKIAMGSMASAFAADLAGRGLLTGNGPSDPDTRKIWLTTHQPNSIKVGDQWVAYGRLEPIGAFFGIAADIQMIMGDLDSPERENLATALVVAVSKNVTSKTYLRGLSEAARALDDPDRRGERYIQQLVGTLIPTISSQITRAGIPGVIEGDPVMRDVRSIYDKLCSRVPGCSTSLPPRRNIWGEPIVLGGGIGPDIMSPVYTNKVKLDPVSNEILRLGVRQQMPSRQIMGVELTPQEYDRYSELAGKSAKTELTKLIKRRDYKTASDGPDGLKALAIKKVFAATRADARNRVLKDRNFRDLRERVEGRDVDRRRKLHTPAQTGAQLPVVGATP